MAKLTAEQIYQVCLEAGFEPDQAVTWTAIALAESGGETGAHNPRGEDSWGLFQVNIDPEVRANPWGDLTNPVNNARAAFEISGGGTNMRPWTVTHASNEGTGKDYRNHMDEARAAAGGLYAGDFSGVSGYNDPNPMGADEPPFTPSPTGFTPGAPAPGLAVQQAPPPTTGQDSDDDGALDAFEMSSGTDPHDPDSDGDGLTDGFELLHGLDPRSTDSDIDGLSDGREVQLGTNPLAADTDADGMSDAMEEAAGTDPLHGAATGDAEGEGGGGGGGGTNGSGMGGSNGSGGSAVDTDLDGLSDGYEASLGTDPNQADTDQDGLGDALEEASGFNPLDADTDSDGLLDGLDAGDGVEDVPYEPEAELPVTNPPPIPPAGAPGLGGMSGVPLAPTGGVPGFGGAPTAAAGGAPGVAGPPGMPAYGAVAYGAPAAPPPPPPPPGDPADSGTMGVFLQSALTQAGDPYVFGAETEMGDPDPDSFDCSELVQWAAAQAGVEVSDGSWVQYSELEERGAVIPVEQAINTPGALLFRFSSDPTAGGRPSQAHVAISLGDGRTIEARGRDYGVGTFDATTERFAYAAVIPELSGTAVVPPDAALAGLPTFQPQPLAPANAPLDSDMDGVTDVFEMSSGTNPHFGDSDMDGLTDGFEVMTGASGTVIDTDHDGLSDAYEMQSGSAAGVVDSDQDGLSDDLELAAGRDPRMAPAEGATGLALVDADSDGLSGSLEASLGSDSTASDSDHDGLTDALELARGTDPDNPDSDADGTIDGFDDD